MGHRVEINSDEQYIAALKVLYRTKGTFLGRGPSSAPVLIVTDEQYRALVDAGVVSINGRKINAHGKKTPAKKTKP